MSLVEGNFWRADKCEYLWCIPIPFSCNSTIDLEGVGAKLASSRLPWYAIHHLATTHGAAASPTKSATEMVPQSVLSGRDAAPSAAAMMWPTLKKEPHGRLFPTAATYGVAASAVNTESWTPTSKKSELSTDATISVVIKNTMSTSLERWVQLISSSPWAPFPSFAPSPLLPSCDICMASISSYFCSFTFCAPFWFKIWSISDNQILTENCLEDNF